MNEKKLPFGLGLDYPAAIIFGAGASRGGLEDSRFPPPVDRDFFEIASQLEGRGTRELAKSVLSSVWELYVRIAGISLEEYYRDVETRSSIGKFAKTANQPKNWKRRQDELEELIRRVYIHTAVDLKEDHPTPLKSEAHQLLLKQLKPNCTVITFNYDLLIEESFESADLWNPVDGYGLHVFGKSNDWCRRWLRDRGVTKPTESRIHLLKLHGSLGWTLYANKSIRLKARPYSVRKGMVEPISVLPPGWNKRIDRNPYKKFWREARLKLEKCKSLMILGYSLPETDLLARALFAEVIRLRHDRKEYLRQLFLVDPSDEVKTRFVNLFNPALGPFGKIFKFGSMLELKGKLQGS